jgi:hypothetical protein
MRNRKKEVHAITGKGIPNGGICREQKERKKNMSKKR